MADRPPYHDPDGEAGTGPGRGSGPGTPRWVKVAGVVLVVVVVLVIVLLLAGHGPGRHAGSDDLGGRTLAVSVTQDAARSFGGIPRRRTPPPGGRS